MNFRQAVIEIKRMCGKWYLRFYCKRFAILVDKETGKYVNLYREELSDPFIYDIIPDVMDPHPKYEN